MERRLDDEKMLGDGKVLYIFWVLPSGVDRESDQTELGYHKEIESQGGGGRTVEHIRSKDLGQSWARCVTHQPINHQVGI